MKLLTEFAKSVLPAGMYFSSFMLALTLIVLPSEYYKLGYVPVRFFFLVPITFITLSFVVYFSQDEKWKTIIKLCVYTLSIVFLGGFGYGLKVTLYNLLGNSSVGSLSLGLLFLVFCGVLLWLTLKLKGAKWLN